MSFSTKGFDPIDYCIEISKMLEKRDGDQVKLSGLFQELLSMYGGPEFIADYANENDNLLASFCWSVTEFSKWNKTPIGHSIDLCYEIHCGIPEKDSLISPEDDEEEIQRKQKVAKKVYERVLRGRGSGDNRPRKRSLFERILGFIRRR